VEWNKGKDAHALSFSRRRAARQSINAGWGGGRRHSHTQGLPCTLPHKTRHTLAGAAMLGDEGEPVAKGVLALQVLAEPPRRHLRRLLTLLSKGAVHVRGVLLRSRRGSRIGEGAGLSMVRSADVLSISSAAAAHLPGALICAERNLSACSLPRW
jgi:hypothetical protein